MASEAPDIDLEDIASGDATPEEVAAYNRAKEEKFSRQADEAERELSEVQRDALDKLAPEESVSTETVTLGSAAEVNVRTHMNEWVENEIETIFDESATAETYRDRMPAVMEWVIVDEEYDATVWREYASAYGIKELTLRFLEAIEPMYEDAEQQDVVGRFRDRQTRSA